jgi:hypothetical protein
MARAVSRMVSIIISRLRWRRGDQVAVAVGFVMAAPIY